MLGGFKCLLEKKQKIEKKLDTKLFALKLYKFILQARRLCTFQKHFGQQNIKIIIITNCMLLHYKHCSVHPGMLQQFKIISNAADNHIDTFCHELL